MMKPFLIKGSRKLQYPVGNSLIIFSRIINLFMKSGNKRIVESFFFQLHKYFKFYTQLSLYRILMYYIKYFTPLFKRFKYSQGSSISFNRGFYKPLKNVFYSIRLLQQVLKKTKIISFYDTFLTNFFNLYQNETIINLPFLNTYDQLFFDRKWHKKAIKLTSFNINKKFKFDNTKKKFQ